MMLTSACFFTSAVILPQFW